MDYYLLKYDTKIKEYEQKKEYAMEIIKRVSEDQELEKKHYYLLIRHTEKLEKYDNLIDELKNKFMLYNNLLINMETKDEDNEEEKKEDNNDITDEENKE